MNFLGITKPSEALEAMVRGLRATKESGGKRQINMQSFGEYDNGVCYGCCATYALAELIPDIQISEKLNDVVRLNVAIRNTNKPNASRVSDFEMAMSSLRRGDMRRLFEFFGADTAAINMQAPWGLSEGNWEQQLPFVEMTIKMLKSRGC